MKPEKLLSGSGWRLVTLLTLLVLLAALVYAGALLLAVLINGIGM